MANRKEQQAELLIQFGALVAPLEEIVKYPDRQTTQTRSRASAKFTHDRAAFQQYFAEFAKGEPGHSYMVEFNEVTNALNIFTNRMTGFRDDPLLLSEGVENLKNVVTRSLLAIPCDLGSPVLEAGSPFSAYVMLRSICETADEKLLFVDPYMGPGTIRRYLHKIPKHVSVCIITKRRGGPEFASFIDVSKLFSDERGPKSYRLMYHPDLHDRYLQCDDSVYHLGGSLKDAGRKSDYTVTQIHSDTDDDAAIKDLINESTEAFGTSSPSHPTP